MVKKPNPSRHTPPKKTYSKEFNLLRPGTGIRFMPQEEWGRPGKSMAAPLRLALLMLLLGGAAMLYLNLPEPPPARRAAPVSIAPPPRILREEAVTANAAPVIDVPVRRETPAAAQTADAAALKQAESPPAAPRWRIRFGIFLLRENAERHAQSLAKKGVIAAAETALRPMSAFTVKAGPANDAAAWKELKTAGEKLNVAPMAEVDGKYLIVGPIWLKDRALVAEKHFRAASVRTEIVEERKDREVFKVVSAPFETAEAAKRAIGEMKTNGIEGVIDE
ncbi:MAG: hypothetical protein HZA03_05335 [Nitrospinae bacterium]|nr:hypothetical protein [Nitrospinota bacterium]